jgi:hypothetical protein
MYIIQHCCICQPLQIPLCHEDARIETQDFQDLGIDSQTL